MTVSVAISLGDVTGIGLEVALKAMAAEAEKDDARYLLIGDEGYIAATNKNLGSPLSLQPF